MDIVRIVKGGAEYGIIAAVIFYLSSQLAGMGLEPNMSQAYAEFYKHLAVQGYAGVAVMGAFGYWYMSRNPLGLNNYHRAGITIGFVLFITFLTMGGTQVIGVPKARMGDTLQLTPATELWTSSVIPGVLEDINYLVLLPMSLGLLYFVGLREQMMGSEVGREEYLIMGSLFCLIAATGYNFWVVPGFTSAHVPAYGGENLSYLGAWVFSFGQSMVYFVTGWFVPAAHILHNYIIAYGQLYAVAI